MLLFGLHIKGIFSFHIHILRRLYRIFCLVLCGGWTCILTQSTKASKILDSYKTHFIYKVVFKMLLWLPDIGSLCRGGGNFSLFFMGIEETSIEVGATSKISVTNTAQNDEPTLPPSRLESVIEFFSPLG